MEIFRIEGGYPLQGEIEVRGSKNAAAPIIAASLLTTEPCVLHNVPRIEDIFRLLELIQTLGVQVEWLDEHSVRIEAKEIDPTKIELDATRRMRLSVLLLGSLSGRCGKFSLGHPGGCAIGVRSIETHIDALESLGVKVIQHEKFYEIDTTKKHSGKIILKDFSVTATEIVLMMASVLPGKTVLKIAAAEPHVQDLGHFLQAMGAKIEGLGTHTITIEGVEALRGAEYTIIPDPIEAATFLILGAATGSKITVKNAHEEHLDLVLKKMREFGMDFEITPDAITVIPAGHLVSPGRVKPEVYPGIPTDTLSLFGVLAALSDGETLIHDHIFESRFNYVPEIEKMGAKATVLNPHQAIIHGPVELHGTQIKSFDLRAGAALIIAALAAHGTTTIEDIYQVDRGYERIEERLQKLGAKIERVEL
ncbi:MAG: UDP-N-acetylglucosamine 1-carboxyvinyltransferase [Candidatus Moraniibacteriota bacterium]